MNYLVVAVCILSSLLVLAQPVRGEWWWDNANLWPKQHSQPWQSYVVRQKDWNKNGLYVKNASPDEKENIKNYALKQEQYGKSCHAAALEAVKLMEAGKDFYHLVSMLGHARAAMAVATSQLPFSENKFGLERYAVAKARKNTGGTRYDPSTSELFKKKFPDYLSQAKPLEIYEKFDSSEPGNMEVVTPLTGQYEWVKEHAVEKAKRNSWDVKYPEDYVIQGSMAAISLPSMQNVYTATLVNFLSKSEFKHCTEETLYKVLEIMAAKYTELIRLRAEHPHTSKAHVNELIASFQWNFAQGMPYSRGSAAIGIIFGNALKMLFEIPIAPTRPGIVLDIEALITPETYFVKEYPTYFEAHHHA